MITWLASYPKSGNTWVRAFLSAYQAYKSADQSFNLSEIGRRRVSRSDSHTALYSKIAGVPAENLNDETIDALRLVVQGQIARQKTASEKFVVKTHNAFHRFDGMPLIASSASRCAVYIVRNPLDIVDSLSDHAGLTHARVVKQLGKRNQKLARNTKMVHQYVGSWSNHVVSWTLQKDIPVLVIKYEDLLRDPNFFFSKILRFIGFGIDPNRLLWALQETSFLSLKTKESNSSFQETCKYAISERFFRHGQAGRWKEVLDPNLIKVVVRDHCAVMRSLEYETPL